MSQFCKRSSELKNSISFLKRTYFHPNSKSSKIILERQRRQTLQIFGLWNQIACQEVEESTWLMTFLNLKLMMNMLFLDTLTILSSSMDSNLIWEFTWLWPVMILFEFMFSKKVLLDLQLKSIRRDARIINSCIWPITQSINDQESSRQIKTSTKTMKAQNGLWLDGLSTWSLKVMTWTKFGQTSMTWFSNHLSQVKNTSLMP